MEGGTFYLLGKDGLSGKNLKGAQGAVATNSWKPPERGKIYKPSNTQT